MGIQPRSSERETPTFRARETSVGAGETELGKREARILGARMERERALTVPRRRGVDR
jgi:hypothetical protein